MTNGAGTGGEGQLVPHTLVTKLGGNSGISRNFNEGLADFSGFVREREVLSPDRSEGIQNQKNESV